MSAECGKCGFDIVYPEGTWPVGVCLNCKQAERIDRLETALRVAVTYLEPHYPAVAAQCAAVAGNEE